MKKLILTLLTVTALTGCSKSSPLHDAMEDMGDNFKALRESNNVEIAQQEFADFQEALKVAAQQNVKPEHQAAFEDGMEELRGLAGQVEAALAAGDLQAAQPLLKKMGEVRKKYHEELGVKKD